MTEMNYLLGGIVRALDIETVYRGELLDILTALTIERLPRASAEEERIALNSESRGGLLAALRDHESMDEIEEHSLDVYAAVIAQMPAHEQANTQATTPPRRNQFRYSVYMGERYVDRVFYTHNAVCLTADSALAAKQAICAAIREEIYTHPMDGWKVGDTLSISWRSYSGQQMPGFTYTVTEEDLPPLDGESLRTAVECLRAIPHEGMWAVWDHGDEEYYLYSSHSLASYWDIGGFPEWERENEWLRLTARFVPTVHIPPPLN